MAVLLRARHKHLNMQIDTPRQGAAAKVAFDCPLSLAGRFNDTFCDLRPCVGAALISFAFQFYLLAFLFTSLETPVCNWFFIRTSCYALFAATGVCKQDLVSAANLCVLVWSANSNLRASCAQRLMTHLTFVFPSDLKSMAQNVIILTTNVVHSVVKITHHILRPGLICLA